MSQRKKFEKKLPGIRLSGGEASVVGDGHDLFVVLDGVKIARRGQPGSKWPAQWISIEPGYSVIDNRNGSAMVIQYRGVAIQ